MKLYEIRQLITETEPDYWNVITSGPLFNYNLGNINEVATVAGWHYGRAVLIEDVDIALEYGMPAHAHAREGWAPEWAQFPDPSASAEYCDVLYRGSIVDRVLLASVDGGRAVLPVPERREGGWIVMDWPYHLARLVDGFGGSCDFEEYFEHSEIEKWPA